MVKDNGIELFLDDLGVAGRPHRRLRPLRMSLVTSQRVVRTSNFGVHLRGIVHHTKKCGLMSQLGFALLSGLIADIEVRPLGVNSCRNQMSALRPFGS